MTMILANVLPDASAGFLATDTRVSMSDRSGYYDVGGKIVTTPYGWACVSGTAVSPLNNILTFLRDIPAAPGLHPIRRLEAIVDAAFFMAGTPAPGPRQPGERGTSTAVLEYLEGHGVYLVSLGNAVGTQVGCIAIAAAGYDFDASTKRGNAFVEDVKAARADLAERVSIAARHFYVASLDSPSISGDLDVACIIKSAPGRPILQFLHGTAQAIANADPRDILRRFAAPDPKLTAGERLRIPGAPPLMPFAVAHDATGTAVMLDTVAQQLTSATAIGANVRGDSTVVFGGTTKYSPSRHNETQSGANTDTKTFAVSYESVPETRLMPASWTLPGTSSTVDRLIEFKTIDVGVASAKILAQITTGATTGGPFSNNPATTLNGTPVASVTINTNNGVAYWDLANANGVLTTYTVTFDVDTSTMANGQLSVTIWTNNGTSSTSWTQVANRLYDIGVTVTGETLSFDATMTLDWDVRILITKVGGSGPFGASVVAKACTYSTSTGGATAGLAGTFLLQSVEPT